LKLGNFLLSEKGPDAVIKIADFGLARNFDSATDMFQTVCGTPVNMAPEVLQALPYNEKADLWSMGTILFELLVGSPPFSGRNIVDLSNNIRKGAYRIPAYI
jgi:serine/threonine-protein kinase ULK/ATG1